MGKKPKVSLFVPFYNEEERLAKNITKLYSFLEEYYPNFELVLVDDASTDNSKSIALSLKKKFKKIDFIYFNSGPTRRENLAVAFMTAKADIVAFIDTDLSADYTDLPYLFKSVSYTPIVIGSKYMPSSIVTRSFSRWFISVVTNWFIRFWFGSKIKDHCCGFKAFKKEVLFDLINEMGYDPDHKRGMLWDAELLIRAQRKGYGIYEFGIEWKESNKSALGIFKEWKMIPYIIKLKWSL